MTDAVRACIVGAGGMARHHIRQMLQAGNATRIIALCEPSAEQVEAAGRLFEEAGFDPPPNQPDLDRLLADYAGQLDVAFIITPHAFHHEQTTACLTAGLDVLLEKPMVMNESEARSLIDIRDRTGRLLVVAFPGSLSPQIRMAAHLLQSGQLGRVLTIAGMVWQDWGTSTAGTWRQQPELSGGGFLFDTGAHMLNTLVDLAGEDLVEVAAWLETNGRPVETIAAVMGRLPSGALVTINACGEAMPSCASEIRVFCSRAILHTGVWGERLDIQYTGDRPPEPIPMPPPQGVWQQFLDVRSGHIPNPCPPEVGLRMARLWDAIRTSSARHGIPVRVA